MAQIASWVVAIAAALYGINAGLEESRQRRAAEERQLRWEHAALARDVLEKLLADPEAAAALRMLDWSGRDYEIKPGQRRRLDAKEILAALRTTGGPFSDKEAFVRDCFDELFDRLELVEHYLRIHLI